MDFTDGEYEGINLKIPYWFYSVNKDKLKPLLDNLRDFFQDEALSYMHPDNQRNIFELENIETKKQIMIDRFESEKRKKIELEKYNEDLLTGNVYEIVWEKNTSISNVDYALCLCTKDGEEFRFTTKDFVTKSYGMSQNILKLYEKLKDNLDIEKTARESGFHEINSRSTYYSPQNKIQPEYNIRLENLSCDVWNKKLTYLTKSIKLYSKHRNGKIYYKTCELYFDKEKKCLCFWSEKEFVYLENYKEINFKFIKIA